MRSLCLLSVMVGVTLSANPGVVINFGQKGLTYAAGIGAQVLNHVIPGTNLPDVSGLHEETVKDAAGNEVSGPDGTPVRFSLFSYHLSQLKINSFNVPTSGVHIGTKPPHTLGLGASGLSASISGHYEVKVGSGWFSVSKSGGITATMSGGSFSLDAAVTAKNGKPALTPGSASANAGSLHITFHGDLIDDIVNQFSDDIAGYLKGKIQPIIVKAVKDLVSDKGNKELAGIPTNVDLGKGFHFDYSLTGNPTVSSGLTKVPFLAKVYNGGNGNAPGYPVARPLPSVAGNNNKMLCAVLDPNEVAGSAAYAAMLGKLATWTLNAGTLKEFGLPPAIFQCSCAASQQCIGKFIPQVQSVCKGAGATVAATVTIAQVPTLNVLPKGAFANLIADVRLAAHNPGGGAALPMLDLNVTASVVIPAASLKFQGWHISGEVDVTGATLSVIKSSIGQVDQAGLEQLWQLGLLGLVQGELKGIVEKGFPIPDIPYVTITQPSIAFGNGDLVACGDIAYHGPLGF